MLEPKLLLQRWPLPVRLALFALLYGASIWQGFKLSFLDDPTYAIWPASGVILSALLLSRRRDWPALVLVALLVEPFSYHPGLPKSLTSFAISTVNTLPALTGAFLLRRVTGFRPAMERVRDVLMLVGVAMLCSVLSATPNVIILNLWGKLNWGEWGRNWLVFWVGDAMGMLLVAPPLLAWAARGIRGWSRARLLELVVLLLAMVGTIELTLYWIPDSAPIYHPASYLIFPFVLRAALRFEARGTTAALLVLATLFISYTKAGRGPFAPDRDGPNAAPKKEASKKEAPKEEEEEKKKKEASANERIAFLHSFLAGVGVSGLLLAAAFGERRRAQEQLRQSLHELATTQQELVRHERMAALGELSASVAHEVRNPLAVIANSVAALKQRLPPREDSTTRELLGIIGQEVTRLDHIVNDLLGFARPIEPRLLPQSLSSVVNEALEASLRVEPHAERVQVTRALDPTLTKVPLDAQLLHLALSNLFINALQAMPQGGSLRVKLDREPRDGRFLARIAITDTGPGIPPEVMARIFEPFYTTKAKGTGLGLTIVRRIVDAHHGEVEVNSIPGQGTTFIVHLPLVRTPRDEET